MSEDERRLDEALARADRVLAESARMLAIGDAIEARREGDGESWWSRWIARTELDLFEWCQGVRRQGARILAEDDPPRSDLELFVIALNLLRRTARHLVSLVGGDCALELVELLEELDDAVPGIAQARHAIEHADQWTAEIGRTQPRAPLGGPPWTDYRRGVVVSSFVLSSETAWYFADNAEIPVGVTCDWADRAWLAAALVASRREEGLADDG
jgi:hypothetical protein